MPFHQQIEKAISAEDPIEALRALALQMAGEGYKREEVYKIFLDSYIKFQDENRNREEDILGDVMDMITGWCGPSYKLDLPD